MSKRSFRTALVVVVATFVLAGGVVAYLVHEALSYPDHRHAGKGVEVEVEITPGMSFPQIASVLEQKGVIDRPRWFRIYGMRRGVTTKVRSGRYVLADNWTPKQVLDRLLQGVEEKQVQVTLPEGKHMLEYFELLAGKRDDGVHPELQVASVAELDALARDPEFLRAHGIEGDTVEGYLYPETYNFAVPTKPAKVLERMINQHRAVWNKLLDQHRTAYRKLRDKLKWSDREILTMASIVEKEAIRADEQSRIAQVFINRLTDPGFKPKLLQTDPTVRYGCQVPKIKPPSCAGWSTDDSLHRAQLDDKDNPYNTYTHEGLPPGPIANPGKGAMAAVLEPDGSNYFYFVAKADGSNGHAFARSLAEHRRNVEKYLERTR
ncbi:MAG: endolytic transglycosylase MltG [Kofleriaceae bacterium]|nr:endolytic transglycosylase MltG [Kofleriaceae bacterium]